MLILTIATIILSLVVIGLVYSIIVQNREFRRILNLKEKRIEALTKQLEKNPKRSPRGLMAKLLEQASKAKQDKVKDDEWAEILVEE